LKLVASSGEPVPPPATEGGLAHLDLAASSLLDTAELGTRSPFAKVDPLPASTPASGPVVLPFTTPEPATVSLARTAAALTKEGGLVSVAGGGDTVAALNHAGVARDFSFVSTAGGAFLEWMEGRTLPGVAALEQQGE